MQLRRCASARPRTAARTLCKSKCTQARHQARLLHWWSTAAAPLAVRCPRKGSAVAPAPTLHHCLEAGLWALCERTAALATMGRLCRSFIPGGVWGRWREGRNQSVDWQYLLYHAFQQVHYKT